MFMIQNEFRRHWPQETRIMSLTVTDDHDHGGHEDGDSDQCIQ